MICSKCADMWNIWRNQLSKERKPKQPRSVLMTKYQLKFCNCCWTALVSETRTRVLIQLELVSSLSSSTELLCVVLEILCNREHGELSKDIRVAQASYDMDILVPSILPTLVSNKQFAEALLLFPLSRQLMTFLVMLCIYYVKFKLTFFHTPLIQMKIPLVQL